MSWRLADGKSATLEFRECDVHKGVGERYNFAAGLNQKVRFSCILDFLWFFMPLPPPNYSKLRPLLIFHRSGRQKKTAENKEPPNLPKLKLKTSLKNMRVMLSFNIIFGSQDAFVDKDGRYPSSILPQINIISQIRCLPLAPQSWSSSYVLGQPHTKSTIPLSAICKISIHSIHFPDFLQVSLTFWGFFPEGTEISPLKTHTYLISKLSDFLKKRARKMRQTRITSCGASFAPILKFRGLHRQALNTEKANKKGKQDYEDSSDYNCLMAWEDC